MKTTVTSYGSGVPVFQHKTLENLPGGYRLITAGLVTNSVIPAGSPFSVDDNARTATVLKSVVVFANAAANAVNYQVQKGSLIAKNDAIFKTLDGAAVTVNSIDTTAPDHDTLTLSDTLGAAVAGDVFTQAAAANADAALSANPVGLSYNDVLVQDGNTVAVSVRGSFYQRRIPAISAEVKALLPNIIFLQSK